jgi:ATP-dependent RNA helicase DeaD
MTQGTRRRKTQGTRRRATEGTRRGTTKDAQPTNTEPPEPTPQEQGFLPEITLEDLPEHLIRAVQEMGWKTLMPVQAKAIPYVLAGKDLMVQSRTGSGKTAAFALPILDRVDPSKRACQALVLVPTRELAKQVSGETERLGANLEVRTVAVYGGVNYGPQLEGLRAGAHIVVGTPGRILDHVMRKSLVFDSLRFLVFDEADRMLSVGFYPDMKALARHLPERRAGYMFSATYPLRVQALAAEFLHEPEMLNLSHGAEHVAETEHVYYEVPTMEKDRCLVRIIEIENPDSAIVFCNTRAMANFVAVVLQRFGYDADQISSDLPQKAREKVLGKVYQKKLRFLVATDVAARGIDISGLSHVILYDFPEDPESYIHRTGRTGRAGASGEAISLVDPVERMQLMSVVRQYGIDMEQRSVPTEEEVQKIVAERVTALLEAKLRRLDGLVRERLERMMPLAGRLGENEDERRVLAMLLDEYYQESLHGPVDASSPKLTPTGPAKATGRGAKPSGPKRSPRRRRPGRRRP